ncbi:GNAT family N-acetyltransferase [Microvirga lotononidis]|uniref:Putative acetyltransferase n=1 Tax=Microvirga lotononidis TaxID=864069 RepID=I4YL80_9HYPH|nr:GNAT family N-acetyltransferase [Microvirga lotononidis]EIM24722.1 putative acetyltransferase [Microvirga lotononidis]WQO26729.1 GNAT family N-acetyltransferase [Microvirga lotononidis]
MSAPSIREALAGDLEAIIHLHEEDELGSHGDVWSAETQPAYEAAFEAIQRSPDNRLFVAVDGDEIVGTFQLTFIPNLTGRGTTRVKVESVKVRAVRRSGGIGAQMIAFAEDFARTHGAAAMELTSNKSRKDAHRFYERLGFARSHEGFKKKL